MANCCSAELGKRHNGSTRRKRHEMSSASRRFRSHGLQKKKEQTAYNYCQLVSSWTCTKIQQTFPSSHVRVRHRCWPAPIIIFLDRLNNPKLKDCTATVSSCTQYHGAAEWGGADVVVIAVSDAVSVEWILFFSSNRCDVHAVININSVRHAPKETATAWTSHNSYNS